MTESTRKERAYLANFLLVRVFSSSGISYVAIAIGILVLKTEKENGVEW